jgi:hypothetical protein
MKVKLASSLAGLLGLLLFCPLMYSHHGSSAYDLTKTISLKATITSFEFSNPHTQVYFEAQDDKGNIVHWVAETTNPAMLARVGWSKDSLKAGDQVTIVANPNRVGAPVVFLEKVVFADGRELDAKKAF